MSARVSIVKCCTYENVELESAAKKAFDLLGGLHKFIKEKEKVLLKPNILSPRPSEDGVNTHVELVRVVGRLVKKLGAVPFIGDSPGGSVTPREAYERSGFLSMAKEEGIEMKEVKSVKVVGSLPIASYFFECDKIISLPKMKTHSLMSLTGAIKNMYGAVSGLNKSECHKRFPKPEEFANIVVDVFEAVKPHLVLMDGIVAMDGDGPNSGRLRDAGLLIAGCDSVAIDSVFAHLIGIDPGGVATTKEASRRGMGEMDINNIEVLGERIEENLLKGFRLPGSRSFMSLPGPALKSLAGFVRFKPQINEKRCRKCMICNKTCPVSAIAIDEKIARIDYKICIRCMCCHEVCPYGAVSLKRNILARALGL